MKYICEITASLFFDIFRPVCGSIVEMEYLFFADEEGEEEEEDEEEEEEEEEGVCVGGGDMEWNRGEER